MFVEKYTKEDAIKECGKGWVHILKELFDEADKRGFDYANILQVKEKFGGLRVYVGGDVYIEDLIEIAEKKANVTCQSCGQTGKLYTQGWMTVSCDGCKA